jgi:hypothetical protein
MIVLPLSGPLIPGVTLIISLFIKAVFTIADMKGIHENRWEIISMEKIAGSAETPVLLPKDYWILSWEKTTDYKRSEQRATLLYFWGITDKIKLFYNEQLEISQSSIFDFFVFLLELLHLCFFRFPCFYGF